MTIKAKVEEWRHVTFTKQINGNLLITLTTEGRERLAELIETIYAREGDPPYHSADCIVHDLMEDALGNGWTSLQPQQIGALTDCELILSDDVTLDDENEFALHLGRVYWHERWMVEDPVQALLGDGLALKGSE